MMKRLFWTLIFAAIFLFGLAMRSPEILAGNYLFGFDQGQNYMRAYDIFVNRHFTLIGAEVGSGSAGVPGLFHGPGFYYLLAFMMFFFKSDPYGGLVLMWIGGVITMLLVFLTVRKMFGEKEALVALFLVSIAPLIAPQSRFVWGPHLASVLIVLYYYFLYRIPDRSVFWTFAATFSAGLLYHFELALSVPLVLLTVLAVFFYKIFNKKVLVSFLLALFLAFSPMIIFEVRHGFMATKGIVKNITTKRVSVEEQKQGFYLSQKTYQFIANYRDSFIFEAGKIPQDTYMIFLSILAVFIVWGILLSDIRTKRYFLLLFLAIPSSFLVFLPLRGAIWPYYLIHLHFVYIYALAVASIQMLKKNPIPAIFILFFFYSMTKGALYRLKLNWLVDYYDYGGKEKIIGKRAIIDYIYADAAGKPFNVFVFMPPVYTWPYDYLFLTYAKEKYGYMPGSEKKGTAYMIIEQDGTKPWSYKGWLETVIITGTPVWEKYILPSDHVLQKRIF